jgi:hypothetical protein
MTTTRTDLLAARVVGGASLSCSPDVARVAATTFELMT